MKIVYFLAGVILVILLFAVPALIFACAIKYLWLWAGLGYVTLRNAVLLEVLGMTFLGAYFSFTNIYQYARELASLPSELADKDNKT